MYFIKGAYKLCCLGMRCPDCSMQLEIHILGHAHIIDSSLNITCEEKQYNINVSAAVQPGRYDTQVNKAASVNCSPTNQSANQ